MHWRQYSIILSLLFVVVHVLFGIMADYLPDPYVPVPWILDSSWTPTCIPINNRPGCDPINLMVVFRHLQQSSFTSLFVVHLSHDMLTWRDQYMVFTMVFQYSSSELLFAHLHSYKTHGNKTHAYKTSKVNPIKLSYVVLHTLTIISLQHQSSVVARTDQMILVLPPDIYLQNGSIRMVTQCLSLEYPHSMKMCKIDQRSYLQDANLHQSQF